MAANTAIVRKMESASFTQNQEHAPNTATAETNSFNKREAFKKLVATPVFQAWHRAEVARRLYGPMTQAAPIAMDDTEILKRVDEMMKPENLRIDYLTA